MGSSPINRLSFPSSMEKPSTFFIISRNWRSPPPQNIRVVGPGSPKVRELPSTSKSVEKPLQLSVPATLRVSPSKLRLGFLFGYRPSKAIRGPVIYSSSQFWPYRASAPGEELPQFSARARAKSNRKTELFIL